MKRIFNRRTELEKRRRLRSASTEEEKILWSKLRNKQCNDLKFRRQYSIGPYIVDFYCPKMKLAIEVDGEVHNTVTAREYDKYREEYIESIGINIIRFKNDEVRGNLEEVLSDIKKAATV